MIAGDDSRGFALIEIIVVLLILGAMGAIGAMAIPHMISGYQLSKDNAHLAQKAQVALTRIAVELNHGSNVSINGGTAVDYNAEYPDSTTSSGNSIWLQGSEILLRVTVDGVETENVLTDGVTGFFAEFNASYPEMIDIELRVQGENLVEKIFTTSIALR